MKTILHFRYEEELESPRDANQDISHKSRDANQDISLKSRAKKLYDGDGDSWERKRTFNSSSHERKMNDDGE